MPTGHATIEAKLMAAFKPIHLEVDNESHMHNVAKGSGTHFKVVVVSEAFDGKKLIEMQRMVNAVLKEEFDAGLHALSIKAKTPQKWADCGGVVDPSPKCMGGSKA